MHEKTCDDNDGGGHFKFDETIKGTERSNEIWIDAVTADGTVDRARAAATTSGLLTSSARAFVVHEVAASNRKILCCDLAVVELSCSRFVPLSSNAPRAVGHVTVTQDATDIEPELVLLGSHFAVSERTIGHVHADACGGAGDSAGGAHWKVNEDITTTQKNNEVWSDEKAATLGGAVDATASASTRNAALRADARSFVVHRNNGPNAGRKELCCDFFDAPLSPRNRIVLGCSNMVPTSTASGFSVTSARVVVKQTNGLIESEASFTGVAGASKATPDLVAHVHTGACAGDGAGHWKVDPLYNGTARFNEVWLGPATVAGTGAVALPGTVVVGSLTSSARSVVVHELLADGSAPKRVCCDLQVEALECRDK